MRNKLNTNTLSNNALFFYSENKNLFKNPNEPEFVLIYHSCNNLFRLTKENAGSYSRAFTVPESN